jgi:hypothetical protein
LNALGLTLAPTFILWAAGTGGALTLDWWRLRRPRDLGAVTLTDDRRTCLGLLAVGIAVFYGAIWLSVDVNKMMYWAIRQPRAGLGVDVLANLTRVLVSWPASAFRFGDPAIFDAPQAAARNFPLLGTLPSLLCLLGLALLSSSDRPLARRVAFGGLVVVGVLFARWR